MLFPELWELVTVPPSGRHGHAGTARQDNHERITSDDPQLVGPRFGPASKSAAPIANKANADGADVERATNVDPYPTGCPERRLNCFSVWSSPSE